MHNPTENVVIITGAVGNLGLATAPAFQAAGHRTVLVDRSHDRLRDAFASLAASPDHLLAGGVDLSAPDSLGKLVADTLARFGRIDVLVNTVGAWRGGKPVHETDLADWDFLFKVTLRTTLLCCRAVIPQMLKQGRGKIINVASRDGLSGSAPIARPRAPCFASPNRWPTSLRRPTSTRTASCPARSTRLRTAQPFQTRTSANGSNRPHW